MFDSLQSKLEGAFKKIRGRGVLTEKDIQAALKEVRMALLEADVNFKVTKEFCDKVAAEAVGESVLKSLSPDQQVIKIVHEKLIEMMGSGASELMLRDQPPIVIMLVGLQGSGKTTTAAKLARMLVEQHKHKPLLVPADVYRPAAIAQLKTLGERINVAVYDSNADQDPLVIARDALAYAKAHAFSSIIIDTAGRLQIDQEMMKELQEISDLLEPHEILLVADAMTGQEAVNVAQGFDQALDLDGLILTKLDGDARGGAALSMKAVTGKPIKLIGLGEKMEALEVFHPERMASRILGMGDVMSLIEKASQQMDPEETMDQFNKMRKNEFSLEDFLGQMRMMKKMGSISSIMGMIPGMNKIAKQVDPEKAEKEMKKVEAIILSMTKLERRKHTVIDGSRRKRIAKGSGTSVQDVNNLLKQFAQMKTMMKKLTSGGMGGLGNLLGGGGGLGNLMNLMKR